MRWDLKHFKAKEFRHPEKMDVWFLRQLDQFRDLIQTRFIITEDFAKDGHSPKSMHYEGRAVDGYFVDAAGERLSALDHLILAVRSPFQGIGIYTWSQNGAFLHLDNRTTFDRKIWCCSQKGIYLNLNAEFIRTISL